MDQNKLQSIQSELSKRVEELQRMRQLMVSIEASEREHIIALEVLSGLPKDRRAFRLIGDVLVERSSAEVLESVKTNAINLRDALENNAKRAKEIETEVLSLTKQVKEMEGVA